MPVHYEGLPEGCPPLVSYYFYLTGGCNLACRHCWISPTFQPNGGTGGHLDFDLFKLAIAEGRPLGVNHVKLTGGEPLLHSNFAEMVDYLAGEGISFTIETNGTLMTPALATHLKGKGLGHISVSLDGATPETHDDFRGVKGSFQTACQGISNLVEAGFRPQVIMSLHIDNVDEIEDLVNLAVRLGASSVKLNLIQSSGRGKIMNKRGQVLDLPRMIELGKWIENDLSQRSPITLYYSWPMAFFGLRRLQNVGAYSCSIHHILGVLHTGHLAMCGIGLEIPELCYGRLGEDRVADVWATHPILLELRNSLPQDLEGICAECLLKDCCLGTCAAHNYQSGGKVTSPNWFCEEADKLGLFPASRRKTERYPELSR